MRALAAATLRNHLTSMTKLAQLQDRGVIAVTGEDRIDFLQGLVSNDVTGVGEGRAVWAALLTPQGKWLADFFIFSDGARLLLDCEQAQLQDLVRRLSRFRLRSRVALEDVSAELSVHAAWEPGSAIPGTVCAPDPRLPEAGWRLLAPGPLPVTATAEDWDSHRLRLALPDGSRDLEPEKTILLEAGFDELNGVSWTKGCYMGQELTARTKYRGLIKRRLRPVTIDGPEPAPGTPIFAGTQDVGTMRSSRDRIGLALLRNEAAPPLLCGEAKLNIIDKLGY